MLAAARNMPLRAVPRSSKAPSRSAPRPPPLVVEDLPGTKRKAATQLPRRSSPAKLSEDATAVIAFFERLRSHKWLCPRCIVSGQPLHNLGHLDCSPKCPSMGAVAQHGCGNARCWSDTESCANFEANNVTTWPVKNMDTCNLCWLSRSKFSDTHTGKCSDVTRYLIVVVARLVFKDKVKLAALLRAFPDAVEQNAANSLHLLSSWARRMWHDGATNGMRMVVWAYETKTPPSG